MHFLDIGLPGVRAYKVDHWHLDIDCTTVCLWINWVFLVGWEDGEYHDDVIKWKHFQRYWPFVRGIHRSHCTTVCLWINWVFLVGWEDGEYHDDVIKWKYFQRYWPFVRGIHRSPVNSPHKGQWRGALMFSLICAWINAWVNNREAGDLRCYRAHHDVTVMTEVLLISQITFEILQIDLKVCIWDAWPSYWNTFSCWCYTDSEIAYWVVKHLQYDSNFNFNHKTCRY